MPRAPEPLHPSSGLLEISLLGASQSTGIWDVVWDVSCGVVLAVERSSSRRHRHRSGSGSGSG